MRAALLPRPGTVRLEKVLHVALDVKHLCKTCGVNSFFQVVQFAVYTAVGLAVASAEGRSGFGVNS